jgi:hypothetical protein
MRSFARADALKSTIACGWKCSIAGAAIALLPLTAQADPIDPAAASSWLAIASVSQAAQPRWMTSLITVTPRLEQEIRWDFYDQQNGKDSQGNGQHYRNCS